MQARRLTSGEVQFYRRYSPEGRTHREPVAAFDALSAPTKLEPTPRGFSVAAARERCRLPSPEQAGHIGAGGWREAKVIELKTTCSEMDLPLVSTGTFAISPDR